MSDLAPTRHQAQEPPRRVNGPCPVCGEPGGFHADQPHQEARDRIPRKLIKEKGWLTARVA